MFPKAPFGRSEHPSPYSALLGSLFLLVACGNDTKPVAQASLPLVEAVCTDSIDNDKDGQVDCDDPDCQSPGGDCVAAPALDRTVASTLTETAAVLYTGSNPLQKGANAKAFDSKRIAMLTGLVVDEANQPLAGVRVAVQGHDEYGYTYTRKDGTYDLAVNGGAKLLLNFALEGRLDAQRAATPGWQRHYTVGSVGLTPASGETSKVNTESENAETIAGPVASDDYGDRQPLVIFQPGTVAEAVLADGTTEPLSHITVTITEYPLDSTQQYLPGTPQVTGLSYGLDFAVAEAKALGATHVTFSEPVSIYVENFLDLPVGTTMPLGYYDSVKGQWEEGQTGNVIEILDIAYGKAVIDVDGDGKAESSSELEGLGITESDLEQLARKYEIGVQLMQGKVTHFSAYKAQVNVKAPKGAIAPNPSSLKTVIDHPTRRGNLLVEPRAVVEDIPITGTPYALTYQSHRTTAYVAGSTLDIPLTAAKVPSGLKRVEARVTIAGKVYEAKYNAKANQTFTVMWDGFDSLNRLLQGPQIAQVYVGYIYNGVLPSGKTPSKPIEVTLGQQIELQVGQWDFKGYELGGFGINVLHAYDPALRTVFYGDGSQRSAENIALVTKPACSVSSFDLGTPDSLLVLADGSLLITDDQQNDNNALGRVIRLTTDGTPTVMFGPGATGNAANVEWGQPQGIVALDDGSIIVADVMQGSLSKVDAKGKQTVLVSSDKTDNPEVVYTFSNIDGIAAGKRQELYIVDQDRVLKLEGGKLSTFAGGGMETEDGVLATEAKFARPSGVVVSTEGVVYISDRDGNRIRSVLTDGSIVTVAGKGPAGFSGDGGNAMDAELSGPRGLALGPDGSLYVVDQGNNRVRRITTDGLIQTVIGGGTAAITDGVLATNVKLDQPDGIAMGSDGSLYLATMSNVLKISPSLPEMSEKDNIIPSEDGLTLYKFDYRGKHLETIDAMTGVTQLKFGYDKLGYLDSISDESGVMTAINRGESRHLPETIVGPYGQTTTVELSDNGWFAKITDPIDRSYELNWNAVTGLLDKVVDPTKKIGSYGYDLLGRIETITDPTGYTETLKATTTPDGASGVAITTKGGRITQYTNQALSTGGIVRSVTGPDSIRQEWTEVPTSYSAKAPDGTKYLTYIVPDQNFGPQSMVPSETSVTLPSGKTQTTSYQRTKKVSDLANALTLENWRDDMYINGRLYSSEYDRDSNTLTSTSPMGRSVTTTLDDAGHPIRISAVGMPIIELSYDEDGRVIAIRKTADGKTRTEVRGYGNDGWVSSSKNAVGDTVKYVWDAVGRPVTQTRPDNQSIAWNFDPADNVTSLTPPGRTPHTFTYDDNTKLLTLATPPNVEQTAASGFKSGQKSYSYGNDQELTAINYSDGRKVLFTYENGQLKTQKLSNATLTYGYANGHLAGINRSDSVKVDLTYDGYLPTGSTWSGAVSGSVKATYDNNFWLSSLTVNNASTVNYSYDDNGLVIGASSTAGAMSVTRDPNTGMVAADSLINSKTTFVYNGFGELNALTTSVSGSSVFGQTLERDDLGRVTSIEEQVGTTTHKSSYAYDSLSRLISVYRDGVVTKYGYDPNGNRTSVQVGASAAVAATYDAQDRILNNGTQSFTHSPAGNLESKTEGTKTLTLTYDELGNLTKAVQKDGTTVLKTIDYIIDGFGRRVARKVNGSFDRSWLYRDGLRPIAEVDSAGTFTHFVYVTAESGAPDFMIRSGVLYRVIKDHLGSVRLVINASNGTIAQSLEYDAFGNVLSETGSGFQPFGFAGGLYDFDTKLVRFGARDYDPGLGRWTNKDPIGFAGGDTNVYAYCSSDPINRIDPTGLDDEAVRRLIALYRDASNSDFEAWDRAREDYRPVRLKGGSADLRDAEHYLFRYWLASLGPLSGDWIPDAIGPIPSPMNVLFMEYVHDPIYNRLRKLALERMFAIPRTTPSMAYWERKGYEDGYNAHVNQYERQLALSAQ